MATTYTPLRYPGGKTVYAKLYAEWGKTNEGPCQRFCEEFIDALIADSNKAVELTKAGILARVGKKFKSKRRA